MLTICEEGLCAGCMACVCACPCSAISVIVDFESYMPLIDQGLCVDCGRCARVCQQLNRPHKLMPVSWQQGWALTPEERASSSSGGLAAAVARGFVRRGGVVCSCLFHEGRFKFAVADDPDTIARFKGSKYVKSDPGDVYRQIQDHLDRGTKVLFVGLPCQVAALKNLTRGKCASLLYTIDLICHGTPAPVLLESFLNEYGVSLADISAISFRSKSGFSLRNDEKPVDAPGVIDRYLVAFLAGLTYTENCYECSYASVERVSDITLGDSWGTNLTGEVEEGISLVLTQTEKGREILGWADVHLENADADSAIISNGQLSAPSPRPKSRKRFVANARKGVGFSDNVAHCLPKECFRQDVKRLLVKLGLWSGGGYEMRFVLVPGKGTCSRPDVESFIQRSAR